MSAGGVSYVVALGGPQGGWRSEPMALAAAREEAQRLMGEGRWLSGVAKALLGEIEVWHEEGGERWLCILATGREYALQGDQYVRDNPWQSVGFAALAGFIFGALLLRSRD